MSVFVRDEYRLVTWNGTDWFQAMGVGEVGAGEEIAPVSTTSTTHSIAVGVSVAIPDMGNAEARPLMVVASGPSVGNSNGITELALFRDSVSLMQWSQPGRTGSVASYEMPRPLCMTAWDNPGPGTFNFTLQFRVSSDFMGTSVLGASTESHLGIHVIEV